MSITQPTLTARDFFVKPGGALFGHLRTGRRLPEVG